MFIPQVAASENGGAQTMCSNTDGVVAQECRIILEQLQKLIIG